MSEFNYPSNSYKSKQLENKAPEEKKKIEKVVKGTVKVKKKNPLTNAFISDEASNVKSYIFADVLIPTIKKTVADIISDSVNMIFFGETNRNKRSTPGSKVSYNDYYNRRDDRRSYSNTRRTAYSYDDIIVPTIGEAEDVIRNLFDIIEEYGMVSVADLYDLVGITGEYTDHKYGWTNLRNADHVRVRDGYLLRLPKAIPLH